MMRKGVNEKLHQLGDTLVSAFQVIALFVIGATSPERGSGWMENLDDDIMRLPESAF